MYDIFLLGFLVIMVQRAPFAPHAGGVDAKAQFAPIPHTVIMVQRAPFAPHTGVVDGRAQFAPIHTATPP